MESAMGGGQREFGKMNWILSKDFLAWIWSQTSFMRKLLLKPRNLMSLLRCTCQVSEFWETLTFKKSFNEGNPEKKQIKKEIEDTRA